MDQIVSLCAVVKRKSKQKTNLRAESRYIIRYGEHIFAGRKKQREAKQGEKLQETEK